MILTLRILRLRQPTCSRRSLRLGCSWPSEIGGSEEESCSLNRPKLGPKGKTTTAAAAAEEAEGRSRSQQSVANELGRNDHDDGGGVHDALIRDRQKQKDEAVERRGEAEADC